MTLRDTTIVLFIIGMISFMSLSKRSMDTTNYEHLNSSIDEMDGKNVRNLGLIQELREANQKLQSELEDSKKNHGESESALKKREEVNQRLQVELEDLKKKQEETKSEGVSPQKKDDLIDSLRALPAEEEDAILSAVHGQEVEFRLSCPNFDGAAKLIESTNSSVIIGYHVGMLKNWKEVVRDQMHSLHTCGLGQLVSKMIISYSNNATVDGELNELKEILNRYKFSSKNISFHISQGQPIEGIAINNVHQECVDREGKQPYPPVVEEAGTKVGRTVAFYFHTKGTSHFKEDWRGGGGFGSYANAVAWRKYLEYFTIERPQLCLDKIINQNKFTCGPYFQGHFFGGNFWTADCKYLASLEALEIKDISNEKWRFYGEGWITEQVRADKLLGPGTPGNYSEQIAVQPHNPMMGLYKNYISPETYSDYSYRWGAWLQGRE